MIRVSTKKEAATMITMQELMEQFRHLKIRPSFWVRSEIKELAIIMVPGEQLSEVVFGWYDNGFALLCCTDQRVLLIDKKPLFLTLEDLRYDKIAELKYLYRLLDSTVILNYAGKTLEFKSWNQEKLRQLVAYIQGRIMQMETQQPNIPEPLVGRDSVFNKGLQNTFTPIPNSNPDPGLQYIDYAMPAPAIPAASSNTQPINPYSRGTQFIRRRVSRFLLNNQMPR